MKKVTYQNGKRYEESKHDWWMYIFVGMAFALFITSLIKWWFCL